MDEITDDFQFFTTTNLNSITICQRSLDPINIETHYIKLVKTSWTDDMLKSPFLREDSLSLLLISQVTLLQPQWFYQRYRGIY